MTKVWEVDALIVADRRLRQLTIVDKDDKISISICSDTGEPRCEIELYKGNMENLSDWIACHIKMGGKQKPDNHIPGSGMECPMKDCDGVLIYGPDDLYHCSICDVAHAGKPQSTL